METPRCKALAKGTGEQCRRRPIPGGTVCVMHGGAAPAVRAAAARRRAEAAATALLEIVWDPAAPPVTNPIDALQALTGKLQHAADVLGARLSSEDLDSPTSLAWVRVLRELRQALEGMERLGIANRHIELEQERASVVTAAFLAALEAGGVVPDVRGLMIDRFLAGLEPLTGPVVVGEIG